MLTNYLLTAKTQRSQRKWFFALAVRGRQSKSLHLFEAKRFVQRGCLLFGRLSRPDKRGHQPFASSAAGEYVTEFMN
jgi:hypothetical protein